jgi:F-type H+-transporting ATPase subunit alpha
MQLLRGEKLTELLKQPQYQPMANEDQVAVLYGATKGFVNDIETSRLQNWARGFTAFLHEKYAGIPQAISQSGQLSDDTKKQLEAALAEFNKSF